MPRVLAVLRLMNSSTFVTCWTASSAGLSPLSSRTYNGRFDGFVVRKFAGEKVKIASGEVRPL